VQGGVMNGRSAADAEHSKFISLSADRGLDRCRATIDRLRALGVATVALRLELESRRVRFHVTVWTSVGRNWDESMQQTLKL